MSALGRSLCAVWLIVAVVHARQHDTYGMCVAGMGILIEFMDGWLRK
jgi:hypothetical protein